MIDLRIWCTAPLFLVLAGCVTTKAERPQETPATEEVVEVHANRLLKPFKSGRTILCRKLDIAVNAAFHHHLVYPAGGSKSEGDGFVQHDWNKNETIVTRGSGRGAGKRSEQRPVAKFRVFVGSTHFIVDEAVRVRKLLKAPPTLTATAAGHVFVTKDGSDAEQYEEMHFENGSVRAR